MEKTIRSRQAMKSKSQAVGVWMALGALAGALIGAVIGVFSQDWSWMAFGVPVGLAVGFGIGAALTQNKPDKQD